jgi:hypothetical protein
VCCSLGAGHDPERLRHDNPECNLAREPVKSFSSPHLIAFNIVLAFAMLTRIEWVVYLQQHLPINLTFTALYALPALLLIVFPSKPWLLLAMLLGQVADATYNAPQIPNHWMLTLITSTVLCSGFVSAWMWRKPFETIWLGFKDRAYLGLGVFYVFTAFWKTNHDFLNAAHSCVFARFINHFDRFVAFPHSQVLDNTLMLGTLLLEYGFGLMLFFHPTRRLAALGLIVFHLLLAFDKSGNYQNFSWTMLAHLILLLNVSSETNLFRFLAQTKIRALLSLVCLLLIGLAFVHAGAWSWLRWLFSLTVLLAVVFLVASSKPPPNSLTVPSPLALGMVFAGLIFLNGIMPILGVKNRNSWQMYSNIRLEADFSNHLWLPPSFDVFGFQRDTVQIIRSSDLYLQREHVKTGSSMTLVDLRNYLVFYPNVSLEWIHQQQRFSSLAAGKDPRLSPPDWWVQKLVWFRPIGPKTALQCAW